MSMSDKSLECEHAVSVTDLVCFRGKKAVIEDLSFCAGHGTAVRIAGANGSGKTTLLKVLVGLYQPHSGQVVCPLGDVAYAGHAVPVKSCLTVTENVTYWLHVYGQTYHPSVLTTLDLVTLADCHASSLSEGQKRRLALTATMASGCRLWLLDEPMVSLDSATLKRLAETIRTHCQNGGTVLYTSPGDDCLPADQTIHLGV